MTLSAAVPALDGASDRATTEVFAHWAGQLMEVAERAVPGLRDRLLWHEVRTPAEVAADTGAADGAIPVPSLAGADGRLLHPANGTRTDGLFTVGGWSHPGGGCRTRACRARWSPDSWWRGRSSAAPSERLRLPLPQKRYCSS